MTGRAAGYCGGETAAEDCGRQRGRGLGRGRGGRGRGFGGGGGRGRGKRAGIGDRWQEEALHLRAESKELREQVELLERRLAASEKAD